MGEIVAKDLRFDLRMHLSRSKFKDFTPADSDTIGNLSPWTERKWI